MEIVDNGIVGTETFIPPEICVLTNTNKIIYNLKTDAFSLGITLIDVFYRQIYWQVFESEKSML